MNRSYQLRRGRLSIPNSYYLVTITTQRRQPVFSTL